MLLREVVSNKPNLFYLAPLVVACLVPGLLVNLIFVVPFAEKLADEEVVGAGRQFKPVAGLLAGAERDREAAIPFGRQLAVVQHGTGRGEVAAMDQERHPRDRAAVAGDPSPAPPDATIHAEPSSDRRIAVRTWDSTGTPKFYPFNLIVAC